LKVNNLKKEHLTEIRVLLSPPHAVVVVLTAVVILLMDFIKANGELVTE
jgi:hypothetical protein